MTNPTHPDAVAYRLEYRPGDYTLYTPDDYARETKAAGATTRALVAAPVSRGDAPFAYRKPDGGLIQAKYIDRVLALRSTPLFVGAHLHEPDDDLSVERWKFERSFLRRRDYFKLTPQHQWQVDANLGLLDWAGRGLDAEDHNRFKAHYR